MKLEAFITNLGKYNEGELVGEWVELPVDDDDLAGAIVEFVGVDEFLNTDPDNFILYSDIDSEYDLGYYWIEESGCYDTKALGRLSYYIDYEAFGRDVALEADGMFSSYGWIERC